MKPIIQTITPKTEGVTYRHQPTDAAKIVFMTANPKDTVALNINKEFMAVQEELGEGKKNFQLRLLLDISKSDLVRILLKERPTILHFSGHGTSDQGLVFQNEQDHSESMDPGLLAEILSRFADTLECVVLNACYSEAQAQAIAQYIPNVIGTNNAIADTKAISFAQAFYMGLSEGIDYEKAFDLAVLQTGAEDLGAGGQPILYRWKADVQPIPTSQSAENHPPKSEEWVDADTGEVYPLVTINGLTWMAKNYAYYEEDYEFCACYEDEERNLESYGGLYTWEGAQELCPKGWRLPTKQEWAALCEAMGGFGVLIPDERKREWDANGDPLKAYHRLVEGGNSGMELILGGGYYTATEDYDALDNYGNYWTATEWSEADAWCIEMTLNTEAEHGVFAVPTDKNDYLSVRYVRDKSV